jgi:hypothetical protein
MATSAAGERPQGLNASTLTKACTFFEVKFKNTRMDYNTISQKFFRPDRPKLMEALECVLGRAPDPSHLKDDLKELGHGNNEEGRNKGKPAWESLAARGLIPMSWVDDPRRRFHLGKTKDLRAYPSSRQAVFLAADVEGVLAVEELARETISRGRGWGRPMPTRALWRMGRNLPLPREQIGEMPLGNSPYIYYHDLKTMVAAAAASRPYRGKRSPPVAMAQLPWVPLEGQGGLVPPGLLFSIYHHRWWEHAVKERWSVTESTLQGFPMKSNPEVEGRLFQELRNPFTPLLNIYERGYVLSGVTEEYFVLFAYYQLALDPVRADTSFYALVNGVTRQRLLHYEEYLRHPEDYGGIIPIPEL